MTDQRSWLAEGKDEPWYNEAKLERAMDEAELDAIVARSARNVVYLSGIRLPGTLHRLQEFAYSPRPLLVVRPRDGDPTLVANTAAHDLAVESGWIDDVRSHAPYAESPWSVAAERLRELGLEEGRIGVARREVNVEDYERFERELPEAELADSMWLLNRVRNVKTDREIELLRDSVEVQDRAHEEVFAGVSPGDTERELHARMLRSAIERGAEWGHGMMQSDNTSIIYGGEGPVPVEDGDLIKTDYVTYHRGYAANLSRMAAMGSATERQRETYRDVLDLHRETIRETIHPGVEAREVWRFVQEGMEERGYESRGYMAGHSTGVWWHQEEPIFLPGVETELRAGMVVCVEPIVENYWHLQDQVLVTDDGPEVLSAGVGIDELPVL